MAEKQPLLSKHDAVVVVLECLIRSGSLLFDERFDDDAQIAPDNLQLLREARDQQLDRLRENLRYARKIAKER